ncbi:MAG: hypothetical protein WBX01_04530 [Nitrososphaeraceae archaeon]
MKNNKTLPIVAMITVAMAALFASATIASYSSNDVSATEAIATPNHQQQITTVPRSCFHSLLEYSSKQAQTV